MAPAPRASGPMHPRAVARESQRDGGHPTCRQASAALQNCSSRGSSSVLWMVAPTSLPSAAQR